MFLLIPGFAFAAGRAPNVSGAAVSWQQDSGFDGVQLVVMAPSGAYFTKDFTPGQAPSFTLKDIPGNLAVDGTYTWELRYTPRVSSDVKRALADARDRGDDTAALQIMKDAGLTNDLTQSGVFTVLGGAFVTPSFGEPKTPMTNGSNGLKAGTDAKLHAAPTDIVQADDVIIQGSLCVGLDCVVNESFGFDTIRLKENNDRIKFDDTSTSAGFPNHDWQLTANDSASGGANKFSIEDITAATVPFTVTGSAPTNSMFIDSSGRLGLHTNSPVLDIHVNTSNTPAMRLEQNNTGGFTAQTWDVAGNEANFFVRDVTGGSRLPFRIRPGATTSSIDISSDGDVGINTASPNGNTKLDIFDSTQAKARLTLTGQEFFAASNTSTDGVALVLGVNRTGNRQLWFMDSDKVSATNSTDKLVRIYPDNGEVSALSTDGTTNKNLVLNPRGGNVGINCDSPTFQLMIASASGCTNPSSGINAGSTTFTVASSRTFKENIKPVNVPDILSTIAEVPVVTYDFKNNGPKNRMGLIAEDFYQVFGRGSSKYIDGQDIEMALWLAVQQLSQNNNELKDRIAALETQLKNQQSQQQSVAQH